MANNKVSLDGMLQSVRSVFNVPQNAAIPPAIYSSIYNTVTSLLLSKLAEIYPTNPSVLDILDPFTEREVVPVKNGTITLPDEYRNILGTPQMSAKKDGSGECGAIGGQINEADFNESVRKSGCEKRPIVIVPQSEFAYRTTSGYDAPTHWDAIGYFSGKREITVCPPSINRVGVMFVRNEKTYVYGYKMQPDDTYIFDANTSVESEWNNAAFEPLFKGICACYAAYTQNKDLRDWSAILNQVGIV